MCWARARAATGLEDFGDDVFLAPLRVLLRSFAAADVHPTGAAILHGGVVKSLATRLKVEDAFARHPEIAEEVVARPIVVVGMMRSGTTMAQRLLASDPRHHCIYGWEVGEPVPRPGTRWDRPDPRIADAEAHDRLTRELMPELVAIHPSDAHEAEEEIMFFGDAFLSHIPEASCDVPEYRAWLNAQDFTPAYLHLRRMLQLLQWQKRQRGEVRDGWVLKTPAHLGYLDTLFSVFPDAHVVHLHRDPTETIPSGASLNHTLWKAHMTRADPTLVGRQWIERMAWTNQRAMATRDRMAGEAGRFTDVRFREAMTEPLAQVERIYSAIGLDLTDDARTAMETWLDGHRREQLPRHRYTAEEFGLSDAEIRDVFVRYIDRYLEPHEAG